MSIKKLFEERVGVLSVISWPWEIHGADWLAVCISDECMRLNSPEEGLTKNVVEFLYCEFALYEVCFMRGTESQCATLISVPL